MNKICTKCKINKSLEEYSPDNRRKDGRQAQCKSCANVRNKIYHAEHRQQRSEYKEEYYSKNKKRILENQKNYNIENRQKIQKYQQNYRIENEQGKQEYNRKYGEENKKKIAEQKAEYLKTEKGKASTARAAHNKKIKIANSINTFNDKEFNCTIFLQNYQCIGGCGRYFDEVEPTRDHIYPASKGGDFIKENIQALCRSCNSKKRIQEIDHRSDIHKEMIATL